MAKEKKDQTTPQDEGWEEIGDHWDEIWEYEKKGESITGELLNVAASVGPNESNVYIFDLDGVRTGVWGTALLDRRMAVCNVGDFVKLVFQGLEKSPKSGREFKDFKVYRKPKEKPASDDVPF